MEGCDVTEAEWIVSDDPGLMLGLMQGVPSDRKLRLFSVACCRGVDPSSVHYRIELEALERFADGLLTTTECDEAVADIGPYVATFISGHRLLEAATSAEHWKAACDGASQAGISAKSHSRLLWHYTDPRYSPYIRDIFGNPFRPVRVNPVWLTPTVVSLATAAYTERALPSGHLERDRLAVLSDALEEAGCTDPAIMSHLGGPGPHVRGCHILDLLLGKE